MNLRVGDTVRFVDKNSIGCEKTGIIETIIEDYDSKRYYINCDGYNQVLTEKEIRKHIIYE